MSDVRAICDAYQAGFDQGLEGQAMFRRPNPFVSVTDEHEAWSLGYAEGKRQSGIQSSPPDLHAARVKGLEEVEKAVKSEIECVSMPPANREMVFLADVLMVLNVLKTQTLEG